MTRLLALTILLAGCGITTGPLSNIDVGGRDRAKVDDDKAACWLVAEAAHGPHSRTRLMVAGGVAGHLARSAEEREASDAKIERHAEECMLARGYTRRP